MKSKHSRIKIVQASVIVAILVACSLPQVVARDNDIFLRDVERSNELGDSILVNAESADSLMVDLGGPYKIAVSDELYILEEEFISGGVAPYTVEYSAY